MKENLLSETRISLGKRRVCTAMRKRLILFAVTSLFSTSLLFAQGNRPEPPNPANAIARRVQFLTTLLALTPDQQEAAATIFEAAATTVKVLQPNLKAARKKLLADVQATPFNLKSITTAEAKTLQDDTNTISGLDNQLIYATASAGAQFYAILTLDQQTTLNDYLSKHPGFPFSDHGKGHSQGKHQNK
jgi:hypothetical protein